MKSWYRCWEVYAGAIGYGLISSWPYDPWAVKAALPVTFLTNILVHPVEVCIMTYPSHCITTASPMYYSVYTALSLAIGGLVGHLIARWRNQ